MDIEHLLLLQTFRESTHDVPTPFMEEISRFSATCLILIPVFLYRAVDKRKGLYCEAFDPVVIKCFRSFRERRNAFGASEGDIR